MTDETLPPEFPGYSTGVGCNVAVLCPYCHSPQVEDEDPEHEKLGARYELTCEDCGKKFRVEVQLEFVSWPIKE